LEASEISSSREPLLRWAYGAVKSSSTRKGSADEGEYSPQRVQVVVFRLCLRNTYLLWSFAYVCPEPVLVK